MYGYIYKTTNLINGMIYVGQHKAEKFSKKYIGSGVNIRRAVKKYGRDNFSVELLEWCCTQEDADSKERSWLKSFGLPNPSIGYNITKGGQERFFTGCTHTEDSRRKMSDSAKAREHPPTTSGRVCYTDGVKNKLILPSDAHEYELNGWHKGKTVAYRPSWNKGLTKDTDIRVKSYADSRKSRFEKGESIGYFGVKGNTNGFKKGQTPWNKGLLGYNNGHPNYYLGKNKNK